MKKKIIKVSLLVFIGLFIFTGGVVAATLTAKDIGFTASNENWNVTNVEDAVNDLYDSCKSYDAEYEDISKDLSLSINGSANLYKLNNTIRLVVKGDVLTTIQKDSSTLIGKITNSEYFPETTIDGFGEGASWGCLYLRVTSDGSIYARQGISAHTWASFNLTWVIDSE